MVLFFHVSFLSMQLWFYLYSKVSCFSLFTFFLFSALAGLHAQLLSLAYCTFSC